MDRKSAPIVAPASSRHPQSAGWKPAPQRAGQRGFTLIELMIVITIMGILVVPIMYLETQSTERLLGSIYRRDLAEAGARSLEWMAKDLRAAPAVLDRFEAETLAPDRLILAQEGGGAVVYALDRTKQTLVRTQYGPGGGTATQTTVLARNLTALTIEPVDPKARAFTARLEFSRELLNVPLTLSMSGALARRLP